MTYQRAAFYRYVSYVRNPSRIWGCKLVTYCSKEMEFCGIIDYFVFTLNVVYFYISISFMLHLMKRYTDLMDLKKCCYQ